MTKPRSDKLNQLLLGLLLASITGAFTWIFEHNSKLAVQDQKLIGLEKRLEENRAQTGKLSDVLHQLDKTMGSLIVEIRNLREEKGRHDK